MPYRGGPSAQELQRKDDLLSSFSDEHSDLVALGQRIGAANLQAVLEIFGAQKAHMPSPKDFWALLERELRNERIRAAFRGNNYAEIALVEGIKERQVRRIVHKPPRRTK